MSVARSLDRYRARYSHVRVGESYLDVTDIFSRDSRKRPDGMGLKEDKMRNTVILSGLGKGERVYALPIAGGGGMFRKYLLDSGTGLVKREDTSAGKKPALDTKQIVPFLLCSPGTKFMGSDEMFEMNKRGDVERDFAGIGRERVKEVFERMGLDLRKDAFALFVRSRDDIGGVVKIFIERLMGILSLGANWKPYFNLKAYDRIVRGFGEKVAHALSGPGRFDGNFDSVYEFYERVPELLAGLIVEIDSNVHPLIRSEVNAWALEWVGELGQPAKKRKTR